MSRKSTGSLFKVPSAWMPIAISIAFAVFIFGYVSVFGATPNSSGDEGLPARIFQIGLFIQTVIIFYFAVRWLPRKPKQAITVLFLQLFAAALPVALILFLES